MCKELRIIHYDRWSCGNFDSWYQTLILDLNLMVEIVHPKNICNI